MSILALHSVTTDSIFALRSDCTDSIYFPRIFPRAHSTSVPPSAESAPASLVSGTSSPSSRAVPHSHLLPSLHFPFLHSHFLPSLHWQSVCVPHAFPQSATVSPSILGLPATDSVFGASLLSLSLPLSSSSASGEKSPSPRLSRFSPRSSSGFPPSWSSGFFSASPASVPAGSPVSLLSSLGSPSFGSLFSGSPFAESLGSSNPVLSSVRAGVPSPPPRVSSPRFMSGLGSAPPPGKPSSALGVSAGAEEGTAVIAGATSVSAEGAATPPSDRKSTRLNSSHQIISYAVFCLK